MGQPSKAQVPRTHLRRSIPGRRPGPVAASFAIVVAVIASVWALSTRPWESRLDGSEGAAPEEVAMVVHQVFDKARCTSALIAEQDLRSKLDQVGHSDWTITTNSEVAPTQCVNATIDATARRVVLMLALRPEVREALQGVTVEFIERCYDKEQAIEYLKAVLVGLSQVGFDIKTDGPLTAPVDRVDEVLRHIDNGCWVYSGTGWTDEGRRIYYISGR